MSPTCTTDAFPLSLSHLTIFLLFGIWGFYTMHRKSEQGVWRFEGFARVERRGSAPYCDHPLLLFIYLCLPSSSPNLAQELPYPSTDDSTIKSNTRPHDGAPILRHATSHKKSVLSLLLDFVGNKRGTMWLRSSSLCNFNIFKSKLHLLELCLCISYLLPFDISKHICANSSYVF